MSTTPESPVKLEYATSHQTFGVPAWRIFFCTVLFAVSHLVAEYRAQKFYQFRNAPPPATYAYFKVLDRIEANMIAEAFIVSIAAVFVLIAQAIFSRARTPLVRRTDWVIAMMMGVAFCGLRWGSWWLLEPDKSNVIELSEAVLLASFSGWLIARWRQPA